MVMPGRAVRNAFPDTLIDVAESVNVERDHKTLRVVDVMPEIRRYNLVILQRPLSQDLYDTVLAIQRQGVPVCVELDDDIARVDAQNQAWANINPNSAGPEKWDWLLRICQIADWMTVSTPALARYGRPGRVSIVRNAVPVSLTKHEADRIDDGKVRVGWSGTVATHPDDLQVTRGAIGQVIADTGATFRVIGDGIGVQKCLGLPVQPEITGWRPLDEYPLELAKVDVGIAPLADTFFNRAKCLDAQTPICTRTGVTALGFINTDDQVWYDGAWHKVESTERELPRPGLHIMTASGHELKLSPEHRLMSAGEWRTASSLMLGDVLSMSPENQPDDLPYVELPWPPDSRVVDAELDQWFVQASSGPKVTIDETWGELLGLFLGDGSTTTAGEINLHCDGQDEDLVQRIVQAWARIGLKAYVWRDPRSFRRVTVSVRSIFVQRFFQSLGLCQQTPGSSRRSARRRIVCVPDVIWRSPRSVLSAFAAGAFESDGHVTPGGTALTLKDRDPIAQMQRLLNLLGVWSRIKVKTIKSGRYAGNQYHRLVVSAASRYDFAAEVGFLSDRKRRSFDVTLDKLPSSLNANRPWQAAITSIESVWITPIDIQVEQSVFAASGFVSHNSALKILEFAALGIPFVASPSAEYSWLVQNRGIGALARRPRDWRRELTRLITDESYRLEVGAQCRQAIAEHDTITVRAHEWRDAWRAAAEVTRAAALA